MKELNKIKKMIEQIKKENIKTETKKTTGARSFARRGGWTLCEKEGTAGGGEWVAVALTDKEEKQAKTKKDYQKKLQEKITKQEETKARQALERVSNAERVERFPNKLEIVINWTRSHAWGYNPRAELWAGVGGYHKGASVGGCGYDKRSTAAADVLGACQELQALALYNLEQQKQETIKKALKGADMCDIFGYGLSFSGATVCFGSGCGMPSILGELQKLGYKVKANHEPNSGADYYLLELNPNSKGGRYNKTAGGAAC